jgi:hypothetical protein
LPDAGGDDKLNMLSSLQIRSKMKYGGASVWIKLEHLHGIAQIKVECFVGVEDVHLGEGSGFEQVVDGGAHCARSAWQFDRARRGVGAAEEAALDRMGLEIQERLDLVRSHVTDVISENTVKWTYEGAGVYRRLVPGLPSG